ncbi:hypothetical protein LK08_08385 [Streptomyces sp. MUSC 125]|nr:hypothetical protein LK08_08385 [Streptomyces sp. MUSC 125]
MPGCTRRRRCTSIWPTGTAVSGRRPVSHPATVSGETSTCSATSSCVEPGCFRMTRKTHPEMKPARGAWPHSLTAGQGVS